MSALLNSRPLRRSDDCRGCYKLIPRHQEAFLAPTNLHNQPQCLGGTGASYFVSSKRKMSQIIYHASKTQTSYLCLTFPPSAWSFFLKHTFCWSKLLGVYFGKDIFPHIKGRHFCTPLLLFATVWLRLFSRWISPNIATLVLLLARNYDAAETLASYMREPRGSRLAFIALTHLVFIT